MATNPALIVGMAAAEAVLPAAVPDGALVAVLLSQGMAFWADYTAKMAAGKITDADVQAAADSLSVDLSKLAADIAAAP